MAQLVEELQNQARQEGVSFDRCSTKLGRFFENLLDACADN